MTNSYDTESPEIREWEQNNRSRNKQIKFAPGDPGYGPDICASEICGSEMPEQRKAWGFKLCFSCQSALER